ncbi:MAG: TonB-dependent receptor, partial [Pyrinomonadaceae bacterium]|nr:TonB-dependent receptor [Pyrinomonadaceae bacterium]
FARDISRVTPVQNITNDVSYIWKTHTFQFGTNVRLISNRRTTFAGAFDSAVTNPSFYPGGGSSVTNPINTFLQSNFGYQIASGNVSNVQNAVTAAIGRYTQYAANFIFLRDGTLTTAGTPSEREFRTQEYDFYAQDIWKLRSDLTITAGLRYGISRPVYEASGYEVKPNIGLGELFRLRAEGAANGTPYNEPVVLDLSGKANGKSPLYKADNNNFQPRIAAAWSPNFGKNWLGGIFGRNNESVIRGGFAITNDYFGQALAVRFDLNNTLGFSSSSQIPANTYNLTTNVGPRFDGFGQTIRNLPRINIPTGNLTFPRQAPNRNFPTAIEGGLDEDLVAPIHYTWSLTYERTLPLGFIVQASYLGRRARNLLQSRDAAAIANFVDTQSGTDWYTAATQLEILRQNNTPVSAISQIPYFANLFPANLTAQLGCAAGYNQTQAVYSLMFTGAGNCGTFYGNDWTSAQLDLSRLSSRFPGQHIFYQAQYGTLGAFSTIGRSDYNALAVSVRQRLGTRLTMDFNYTLSKTMDEGSGLQNGAVTSGAGFILNPFRQEDMYAVSDFDSKHIINVNGIFKLPFGRGEPFLGGINKYADIFVGGWQLTGIFRYNSGLPFDAPFDDARWATNWNVQSNTTRINGVQPCPTRGGKLFGCNTTEAYRSFRNAYPGETGERNVFRLPGYRVLDLGLGKSFNMPWSENHKLQFRWEAFNVTNTQQMGAIDQSRSGYGIGLDVATSSANPPSNWSNFTGIQGDRRIMQFVLRYSF